ncbi:MAG: hypothetical protein ACOY82_01470 [Pseudomonadota bacterium]
MSLSEIPKDALRIFAAVVVCICCAILAHWKIRNFLLASAIAGAATSVWVQIMLRVQHDRGVDAFATVFGFLSAGAQYFALSAMVGVFFEMRRRRERK